MKKMIEYISNKFNGCNSKTKLLDFSINFLYLTINVSRRNVRNGSTLTKNGHRLLRSFESFAYTIILSIL